MVGRGGRSSNKKIYKDSFILIDGGDNIAEFGEWSMDRDWEHIFFNGIGKPKAKRDDILDVQDCEKCGALFPKSETVCPECDEPVLNKASPKERIIMESDEVLEPVRKIPPPNANENTSVHRCSRREYPLRVQRHVFSNRGHVPILARSLLKNTNLAKKSGNLTKKFASLSCHLPLS